MPNYPISRGRIQSRALEVNVAYHCNLRCRSCSHASPNIPRWYLQPEALSRDLRLLAPVYHAQIVKILGGEPLLHPDLPAIIDLIRDSAIGDKIRLVTNGTLLLRLPPPVWGQFDEIWVSQYPGQELERDALLVCNERAASAGVRLAWRYYAKFRESIALNGTSNEDLVARIFNTCLIAHSWQCNTLAEGHLFLCPLALFIPMIEADQADLFRDGEPLDGGRLLERLSSYLNRDSHLLSCQRCLGAVGRQLSHSQVPRREWRGYQAASTEELLDYAYLSDLENGGGHLRGCVERDEIG